MFANGLFAGGKISVCVSGAGLGKAQTRSV
jgi:hypothetical protein